MAQPEFPAGSIVRAFKKGEVHYVGEFLSCDGQLITLRTMGPQGAPWLDCFEIKGFAFECWVDLKGVEGVAFLRLMDKEDDWCDRSFFKKFAPRELEILFLEGDVRIRDDAAECIPEQRLVELILEQDNFEAAAAALERIVSEEFLDHLARTSEDRWTLDQAEARELRVRALKRYDALRKPPEPEAPAEVLPSPTPAPARKKGELPPTYVEKQERLKAAEKAARKAAKKERETKPWWRFW